MKLTFNYLFLLCLLFVKGQSHAFAACEHSFRGLPVQTPPCKKSFESNHHQSQDNSVQYVLFSGNDDEEDDITPERKKASASRFQTPVLFSNGPCNAFTNNRRLCERFYYLSQDLYILHRTLRVWFPCMHSMHEQCWCISFSNIVFAKNKRTAIKTFDGPGHCIKI